MENYLKNLSMLSNNDNYHLSVITQDNIKKYINMIGGATDVLSLADDTPTPKDYHYYAYIHNDLDYGINRQLELLDLEQQNNICCDLIDSMHMVNTLISGECVRNGPINLSGSGNINKISNIKLIKKHICEIIRILSIANYFLQTSGPYDKNGQVTGPKLAQYKDLATKLYNLIPNYEFYFNLITKLGNEMENNQEDQLEYNNSSIIALESKSFLPASYVKFGDNTYKRPQTGQQIFAGIPANLKVFSKPNPTISCKDILDVVEKQSNILTLNGNIIKIKDGTDEKSIKSYVIDQLVYINKLGSFEYAEELHILAQSELATIKRKMDKFLAIQENVEGLYKKQKELNNLAAMFKKNLRESPNDADKKRLIDEYKQQSFAIINASGLRTPLNLLLYSMRYNEYQSLLKSYEESVEYTRNINTLSEKVDGAISQITKFTQEYEEIREGLVQLANTVIQKSEDLIKKTERIDEIQRKLVTIGEEYKSQNIRLDTQIGIVNLIIDGMFRRIIGNEKFNDKQFAKLYQKNAEMQESFNTKILQIYIIYSV